MTTTIASRAIVGALIFSAALSGVARAEDDGQWRRPGKDLGATRYSSLSEITVENAARLRPTWTFSTGVLGGH
jgi:methanol dehydrogenase (cytochrome c) subunit 1